MMIKAPLSCTTSRVRFHISTDGPKMKLGSLLQLELNNVDMIRHSRLDPHLHVQ